MLFGKKIILAFLLLLLVAVPGGTQPDFWVDSDWFIYLYDAPPEHDYSGQTGRGLVGNTTEDGLIFSTITGTGGAGAGINGDDIVLYGWQGKFAAGYIVVYQGDVVTYDGP